MICYVERIKNVMGFSLPTHRFYVDPEKALSTTRLCVDHEGQTKIHSEEDLVDSADYENIFQSI